MGFKKRFTEMRGIEVHIINTVSFHFKINRARNNIARCEFCPWVVGWHEACRLSGCPRNFQLGALTAKCLGNEKTPIFGVVEAGGVKLNEFHVGHTAPCSPGHGNTIAGRRIGIAGVAVDLSDTPAGQHHGRGRNRFHTLSINVQHIHAVTTIGSSGLAVSVCNEIQRDPVFVNGDVGVCLAPRQQGVVNGLARSIGCMRNPAMRVAALSGQVQAKRALRINRKRHPEVHQPLNGLGTLAGHMTRR